MTEDRRRTLCPQAGHRAVRTSVPLQAPVRQWVLSLPHPVRVLVAVDADHCRAWPGAVNVVQRSGSSLALNVHFHLLVLDGVHVASRAREQPTFDKFGPLPPRTYTLRLDGGLARRVDVVAGTTKVVYN